MNLLIIGLIVFLGLHLIGALAPAWRARMRSRMGTGAWKGVYAILSLIGLILVIKGYAVARTSPVVLYTPLQWMRSLALVLMLPAFPLLFAAYLPGRIKTAMKHPMLVAVKLWAFAHLLANGTLADVVLFGSFLAWAVIVRISFKHRPPQVIATAPRRRWNDAIAVVIGLAVYVLTILWLHVKLIGVSPLG